MSRKYQEDESDDLREAGIPVAQYVRMSTEHQKYSTENQAAAISAYAAISGDYAWAQQDGR